jgi:acyl-CoA synthetase (AMP-forming)/AMP-acid ligase II
MTNAARRPLMSILEKGERDRATRLRFVDGQRSSELLVADLVARARRVAAGLAALGVKPGDRVSSQLTNGEQSIELQFAALMVEAVLVPVVPVFGPKELGQILADAQPVIHVTHDRWGRTDYLANLKAVDGELLPNQVIVVGDAPGQYLSWSQLAQTPPLAELPADGGDTEVPCLIIYTSGSTGVPKGVQHTQATAFAEVVDLDYRASRGPGDVYLQVSAAGHIGGYMYPLRAIWYEMETIVMDSWDAQLACRMATTFRVSGMVATPFHAVSMLEVREREPGVDLTSIKLMMIGGAPVTDELLDSLDAAGVIGVRAYGMSEHPTIAIGSHHDSLADRRDRGIWVTPANKVRIVDDDGKPVPDGTPGEIQSRGPERLTGYTNAPSPFTSDGWFPTGDIGVFDDEGRLSVVDRKKNIIIRGGENLSATEIENTVRLHPAVADAAVIGVPDKRYGERVCAWVVLRPDQHLDLAELMRFFLDQGLTKQKVPEFLEFAAELPRTGTGKIRKSELAALFAART